MRFDQFGLFSLHFLLPFATLYLPRKTGNPLDFAPIQDTQHDGKSVPLYVIPEVSTPSFLSCFSGPDFS
jgi:hypothetical protein